jgi:protein gp37
VSKSNIEWTEETWNPIVGCSIVSPGCTNCYAMKMAARIEAMARATWHRGVGPVELLIGGQYIGTTKKVNGKAVWTGKLALAPDSTLLAPLRRKKPTTYFVNSMGDLFHEDCPDEWIDRVFAVMALTPQHTYQVLTKRAARMRDYINEDDTPTRIAEVAYDLWTQHLCPAPSGWFRLNITRDDDDLKDASMELSTWPLPNVWLGVSTERQQEADERIPHLLRTPAAVRFISAEPLLGPIDLAAIAGNQHLAFDSLTGQLKSQLTGELIAAYPRDAHIDWVIAGGESGPNARPMHPDWARRLRDQCKAPGVPFFFKQWGSHAPSFMAKADSSIFYDSNKMVPCSKKAAGRLLDGVLHDGMPNRQLVPAQ